MIKQIILRGSIVGVILKEIILMGIGRKRRILGLMDIDFLIFVIDEANN
jgi:hypothetical protein